MSAGHWVNQATGATGIEFECLNGSVVHVDLLNIKYLRVGRPATRDVFFQIAVDGFVFDVSEETHNTVVNIMRGC